MRGPLCGRATCGLHAVFDVQYHLPVQPHHRQCALGQRVIDWITRTELLCEVPAEPAKDNASFSAAVHSRPKNYSGGE